MAWIKMLEPYIYRPSLTVSIHYKVGHTYNVPRDCAAAALGAGKAVRMRKTHRDDTPEVDGGEDLGG